MANTGVEIVLTLEEIDANHGNTPTGQTKANSTTDPDYIAPFTNTTNCPVTYTANCPTVIATVHTSGVVEYEFSLPNSTVTNPSIGSMTVSLMQGSTVIISFTSVPQAYQTHEFTGVPTGQTYTMQLQYFTPASAVYSTCSNLLTINT